MEFHYEIDKGFILIKVDKVDNVFVTYVFQYVDLHGYWAEFWVTHPGMGRNFVTKDELDSALDTSTALSCRYNEAESTASKFFAENVFAEKLGAESMVHKRSSSESEFRLWGCGRRGWHRRLDVLDRDRS